LNLISNSFGDLDAYHLAQYIIAIVVLSAYIIGTGISVYFSYNNTHYLYGFYVICFLLILAEILPNVICLNYLLSLYYVLSKAYLNDCFDSISNTQFQFFSNEYSDLANYTIITVVLNVVQLILNLIALYLLKYKVNSSELQK
jgi:hypothetical protein